MINELNREADLVKIICWITLFIGLSIIEMIVLDLKYPTNKQIPL
jgi:hypothetical protein